VLAALSERPMHPYEISTTLRQRAKEESIKLNYGSLYSVVDALAKHGLIEVKETVRKGRRPERTIYAITDAGESEFADWLSEMLSTPVKEFTQFEAALALLAGLPPDDVVALLQTRRMRLNNEITGLRAGLEGVAQQGLPRLFTVESEYWLALREAELRFVEQLIEQIRDGTLDGVDGWRRYHETGELPTHEDFAERRERLRKLE
jgi:DNA-binding PadR family transcriptional regulator